MLANKEVFQQIQYADLTKSWRKVLQDKVFADLIFVFFMPYIVSLHTSALSLPPPPPQCSNRPGSPPPTFSTTQVINTCFDPHFV